MLIIISIVYNVRRRDKRVLKCKWSLIVINLNCYNFEIFYVSPLVTTKKIPIQVTQKKIKSIKKNPKQKQWNKGKQQEKDKITTRKRRHLTK